MTPSEDRELAAAVDAAVRAIPEVTNVFRSGALASQAIAAAAERLGLRGVEASPVSVRRVDEGAEVEVSLGIALSADLPETLRRAHEAVAAALAVAGVGVAELRITVVHMQG